MNLITAADLALLNNRYVETWPASRNEAFEHVLAGETNAELEAGLPRLRHLELRGADLKAIADADHRLDETFSREVLAEDAPRQIHAGEPAAPVPVVFGRIDVHGLARASVHSQIRLLVAFEVERVDDDAAF